MLTRLEEIFDTGTIEKDDTGKREPLNSHTPKEQGVFLQEIYDEVKPKKSLEVGLALGLSTLFILEKCRQHNGANNCHVVIEPYSWGPTAMHNIRKEGLDCFIDLRTNLSHHILPLMFIENERVQYAYVDTTKVFDVVMQDFYFIDKILDVGGVIILDDANTPGIEMVVRVINSLPHYEIMGKSGIEKRSWRYTTSQKLFEILILIIPFKKKFMNYFSFKTNRQLGLDCRCIAFRKINEDTRPWNWNVPL